MRMKLETIPMGNKVHFRVQGNIVCDRCGILRKSFVLDRKDSVTKQVFGSQRKVDAFLKANRKRNLVVDHSQFMLDECDHIR